MRSRMPLACLSLVLLAVMIAPVAAAAAGTASLGQIQFPNSGAPAAQDPFVRGMLLLHSFEYEDAREAFVEARTIDPSFAMAVWGEAMTYNHPLWREQDLEAARAALARLAPTPEARQRSAKTPRERAWIEAADILFGEGDKVARDIAYAAALGRIAASWPEDLEARAFHSLAILGTAQGNRDFGTYMRAGAVAEEVFAANPQHPGAAHYLIHSYDDPIHAPLGLRAARVYATIAPAAPHAQHMISHIYVALGQWAESVDANVKSFEISVQRRERKKLGADAQNLHALHWLEYSYLQLGQFEKAKHRLDQMARFAEESGSPRALWHLAVMRAAWIVETGNRPGPDGLRSDKVALTGAAADTFATGYAALAAGRRDEAQQAVDRLAARHDMAASSGHLCAQTGSYTDTSKSDLIVAEVMRKSLEAMIARDAGDSARALRLMDEATAAEDAMPIDFGPPAIVKPSHEIYGEMLLAMGRADEAKSQFEKALARAPRRALSLAGLARAAAAAGRTEAVAKACGEIRTIYAGADPGVRAPETCPATPIASGTAGG